MTGRAGPAPARVRELAEQGYGRNACALELGVSRRQIDTWAKAAGITWVRSSTEAATRARMADRRAELVDDFSEISDRAAERLLQALDADDLDPNVIRALVNAAGTSADKLTALADRIDTEQDSPDNLLDQLRRGIDSWHAGLADQTDQTDTTDDAVGGTA